MPFTVSLGIIPRYFMAEKRKKTADTFFLPVKRFLGSNKFFYLIITLVLVQALWVAASFRPGLYDEAFHYGFIDKYSHRINPFFSEQSSDWDFLGSAERNSNYLFYYLFSLPLRFFELIFNSEYLQVIALRLIFIGLFVYGLILYRRLLIYAGGSKTISNLSLLFLMLIPGIAPLPAAINYDNVIFVLFPLLAINAHRLISEKKIDARKLALILALGIFTVLMKVTSIAFVAPIFLYVAFYLIKRHGSKLTSKIAQSAKTSGVKKMILPVVLVVLLFGFFAERDMKNLFEYKKLDAPCVKVIGEERCLKNYTAARSIKFRAIKPANFDPINPIEYTYTLWFPGMTRTSIQVMPSVRALPVMNVIFYILGAFSAVLILIYLRDFLKNEKYRYLIFITAVYLLALWHENYAAYERLGQPVAISSRYFLPVFPILIFLALTAFYKLFARSHQKISIILAIALLGAIATQGGGITTYLFSAKPYYWSQDSIVTKTNVKTEEVLRDIVKE